jgi:hypothetical protein
MNTTRAIARIVAAVQSLNLPPEQLEQVMDEVWTIRTMSYAGQVEAIARWRECIATWPAAS